MTTIWVLREVDGIGIEYSRSCRHPWQLDELILAEDNEPGMIVDIIVEEES